MRRRTISRLISPAPKQLSPNYSPMMTKQKQPRWKKVRSRRRRPPYWERTHSTASSELREPLKNSLTRSYDFIPRNLSPATGPPPQHAPNSNEVTVKPPPHPAVLQKIYYTNKSKALRLAIGTPQSPQCDIPIEQLCAHFQKPSTINAQEALKFVPTPSASARRAAKHLTSAIRDDEVRDRLLHIDRSKAPGPSGLRYSWLMSRPICHQLARIYTAVLEIGLAPKQWKKADLILILKKGDRNIPSNWRPIALQEATYV